MKNILILTLLCLIAISCDGTDPQIDKLSPEEFYKRDMIITVNGETLEGALVAKKAENYKFNIESRGNLDLFVMTSCHKEETKEAAWNVQKTVRSGLFGWGRKKIDVKNQVEFTHFPNALEAAGDCPLELAGYDKNGRHSWGLVDFESDTYKLPAKVECNGRTIETSGTSICQARAGLVQRISFEDYVVLAENNDCGISHDGGKSLEFTMPKGKCVMVFGDGARERFHKITLIGYDKIIIRE